MSKFPVALEGSVQECPLETQNTTHAASLDSDLLAQQFSSLNASLDKLNAAIVSLKPQSQSNDKKTAFWKAYTTLADEFDEDFQRKYGNDLDSVLIFAGLFSAVSSEFQPNPNAMTQGLLGMLIKNMTGAAVPLPPPHPSPPVVTVVAQSLLYISLSATLMAALLAVLGKQWLLHYNSVGERGTIEERGLERQRKFDGLQRWKFDLVMQMMPLLQQLALLLFAVALSFYLRTINHTIAIIIIGLTTTAFILYAAMVLSALAFPDSPFQTSLTTLLRLAITVPIPQLPQNFHPLLRSAFHGLASSLARAGSVYTSLVKKLPPLLPQFKKSAPSIEPTHIFDQIPPASKEVEAAAALTPSLQWPVDLDLRQSLKRLSDTFNQCLDHRGNRRNRDVVLEGRHNL
ncbi:hypothetical protein B0H14DRAFT_3779790 [Mycena olivaceomarginata]|nr:hypothetical protein B0H14DRAFT_3779790 [Mycena olivaceomarginata]